MNNGFFAVILIIIILVFGGVMYYATDLNPQGIGLSDVEDNNISNVNNSNNMGLNNSSTNINTNTSNKTVVAIQSGPAHASEGSKIDITWAVKNDANSTITNVKAIDQNFDYDFGSLAPGESKSVNYTLYIPTINDLKSAGFDVNDDIMDEFLIGGFGLSYSMNGQDYTIKSNDITIILK